MTYIIFHFIFVTRIEREKATLMMECKEAKVSADRLAAEKAALEKEQKIAQSTIQEFQVIKVF